MRRILRDIGITCVGAVALAGAFVVAVVVPAQLIVTLVKVGG